MDILFECKGCGDEFNESIDRLEYLETLSCPACSAHLEGEDFESFYDCLNSLISSLEGPTKAFNITLTLDSSNLVDEDGYERENDEVEEDSDWDDDLSINEEF